MSSNPYETARRNPLKGADIGFPWKDKKLFIPEIPQILTTDLPLLKEFQAYLPGHNITKSIFREIVELSRKNPEVEQRFLGTQMSLNFGDGTGLISKLYGTCTTPEAVLKVLRETASKPILLLHSLTTKEYGSFLDTAHGNLFDPKSLLVLDSIQKSVVKKLTKIQYTSFQAKQFRKENAKKIKYEGKLNTNKQYVRYNDSYTISEIPHLIGATHSYWLLNPVDTEAVDQIRKIIPEDLITGAIPPPTDVNLRIHPEHLFLLLPMITDPFLRGEIAYIDAHPKIVDDTDFLEKLADFYTR